MIRAGDRPRMLFVSPRPCFSVEKILRVVATKERRAANEQADGERETGCDSERVQAATEEPILHEIGAFRRNKRGRNSSDEDYETDHPNRFRRACRGGRDEK
jgi:hypothetical protein